MANANLRQSINTMEMGFLAQELKDTGDWEKAKARLPSVDPDVLEKGFKKWAFKAAGIDLEKYEAAEKAKKSEPPKKPDPLK